MTILSAEIAGRQLIVKSGDKSMRFQEGYTAGTEDGNAKKPHQRTYLLFNLKSDLDEGTVAPFHDAIASSKGKRNGSMVSCRIALFFPR